MPQPLLDDHPVTDLEVWIPKTESARMAALGIRPGHRLRLG